MNERRTSLLRVRNMRFYCTLYLYVGMGCSALIGQLSSSMMVYYALCNNAYRVVALQTVMHYDCYRKDDTHILIKTHNMVRTHTHAQHTNWSRGIKIEKLTLS